MPGLTDTAQPVVEIVIGALGDLRATNAVPELLDLLGGKNITYVAASATALGKIGETRAVPILRKLAVDVKQPQSAARASSWAALRQLGDREMKSQAMRFFTEKVIPPPPGGGSEPSYDDDTVRAAALRYLAACGDGTVVKPLLDKVADLPSYDLRKVLAEVVGQLTGVPHRAAWTTDYRRYFLESLADTIYPITPSLPGIEPAN
jgi:HEAT repeat protein